MAAATVYLIFAIPVLLGVLAGLAIAAGLAGYFAVFVAVDGATYGRAVSAALVRNPAGEDHALTRLSGDRARGILGTYPMVARRIAFYCLPFVAVVVAVAVARWRSKALPRRD